MPPDTNMENMENMEANDELNHDVEDEIKHDATQLEADAMNLDGANDTEPAAVNGMEDSAAAFEARIPAKKDATLREFLGKMDEYAPIVRYYPSSFYIGGSCTNEDARYPMR
jgi:transcription initiation factor TFIID subunit 10